MSHVHKSPAAKLATLMVFDMAAVVHMVKPSKAGTFEEYTLMHLLLLLEAQLSINVS